MLDFMMVSTRATKNGVIEVYPKFIIKKSEDLMIRGGDFYAIWVEDRGLWSTDEQDALTLIDEQLDIYAHENKHRFNANVKVLHMWDAETGMIDSWHKYCQKQSRDFFHMLDEKLVFSNSEVNKKDYASKRLTYPLEAGGIDAYDKLMSTLYSAEERRKIEWAIGAIVTGDSKKLQKFMVFYGAAGTGKSTVISIIQKLFSGYCATFESKVLGSASASFALEQFKTNPLVAIEHDGDLSRIEDNSRINSLVSHEDMTVNEKFKSAYSMKFKSFLILGTNRPVKITDGKSGLLRRLIDVSPTGEKVPMKEYDKLIKQIDFELGAIASHCRDVYLDDKDFYDSYIPTRMLSASNDFYNFVEDIYFNLDYEEGLSLNAAWEAYKTYCEVSRVPFPMSKKGFKEELKNYFHHFHDTHILPNGEMVRNYYIGLRTEKFKWNQEEKSEEKATTWIEFKEQDSIFDAECSSYSAQYAAENEAPSYKWEKVKTTLKDVDTHRLHYVKVPENHIVIDFDIKDKDGVKSFEKNMFAAGKFPATYAELSKSGSGIHLHYIYTSDLSKLSRVYDDHIEVKIFTGKSALRRKLTKCNNLPIANINSGLPLKGDDKVINFDAVKSEKGLRTLIKRNLNKEIHPGTKPSIDFIFKILEDAYKDGLHYDVTDMRNTILGFAANSTNQAEYCIKMVNQMKFKSEDISANVMNKEAPIVFYDVEVFPNLFLLCWKLAGEQNPVVRMINPKPEEIEKLLKFRLIGFNCRRYDNHILYAALMGYSIENIYKLSQKIISSDKKDKDKNCFFGEAYNISYTDVYDFAATKQSLKKWEIELGIHHQELGLPWDKPVPEDMWVKVSEYCDNDVIATEKVFDHLKGDWTARQILADLAGSSVNDTTNTLTTRIIFGNNRRPQDQFNYRFMGIDVPPFNIEYEKYIHSDKGKPVFPGYIFENSKSTYRGEEIGEGGYVYAEPGIYGNVALVDVASMHPSSIIAEELFGKEYTKRFGDIVEARIAIKHKDFAKAKNMLGGTLAKYLDDEGQAKALAGALKIAINSVYGLTSAKFDNPFRDIRNIDNIVAKRGALFMVNLKYAVQEKGFIVVHCKTDSIKVADATPEIIQFIMDYGKQYGYSFEHEATYDRMCLVNDAVYIARYAAADKCEKLYGYIPGDNYEKSEKWTATGTQFAVPYVFKTCFTKEDIVFADMCETKSVKEGVMYLDMNESLPDDTPYLKEIDKYQKDVKKGVISESNFETLVSEIQPEIDRCHDYHFVGRVGLFCPIKSGCGGGELKREKEGKYYAVSGTKGYRWLEAEVIQGIGKESEIDRSYYDKLVSDTREDISLYGDYDWFVSDAPYIGPEFKGGVPAYDDGIPFA